RRALISSCSARGSTVCTPPRTAPGSFTTVGGSDRPRRVAARRRWGMSSALLPVAVGCRDAALLAPEGRPGAGARTNLLREGALTACAGLLVVAFGVVLLWHDPWFFWRDDYQTYHLAGYCDIARSWSEGEVPLLSPYTWQGGALAGEYQYGVFS